jgi:hypothetical protein
MRRTQIQICLSQLRGIAVSSCKSPGCRTEPKAYPTNSPSLLSPNRFDQYQRPSRRGHRLKQSGVVSSSTGQERGGRCTGRRPGRWSRQGPGRCDRRVCLGASVMVDQCGPRAVVSHPGHQVSRQSRRGASSRHIALMAPLIGTQLGTTPLTTVDSRCGRGIESTARWERILGR